MIIFSAIKNYTVDFVDLIDNIIDLQKIDNTYFVIDSKVYELYKDIFSEFQSNQLTLIEAKESNKNIDTVLSICERMTQINSKRNTTLISIGGGIIQDITGFVANVLYRGIKWIYVPTTLLAACDSCIGGKSSLNYNSFKNLLGSFYPPDRILIYQFFFNTLSQIDYCSGLGEVVKFNVIGGKDTLSTIEKNIDALLSRNYDVLLKFITNSLEFKKVFIEEDEFDKGKRILLNFAHTFGHAFETTSSYAIPHGSAVVLGMIAANAISLQRGILDKDTAARIENISRKIIPINLKKEWFQVDSIINAIKKDKKQTGSSIRVILLNRDFILTIYDDITISEIGTTVDYLMKVFCNSDALNRSIL
jgi:3-dehydroquinate synthase